MDRGSGGDWMYSFALWILHPLTDAPVVDSWLYGSAVRRFLRTGEMRFAGFTQDMPIAQVYYGVAWSHAFGGELGVVGTFGSDAGGCCAD